MRAWYFVSDQNPASIDLHARFGFGLVARDVWIPGVKVTGTALLYGVDLSSADGAESELGEFGVEIETGRIGPGSASVSGVKEEIPSQ